MASQKERQEASKLAWTLSKLAGAADERDARNVASYGLRECKGADARKQINDALDAAIREIRAAETPDYDYDTMARHS